MKLITLIAALFLVTNCGDKKFNKDSNKKVESKTTKTTPKTKDGGGGPDDLGVEDFVDFKFKALVPSAAGIFETIKGNAARGDDGVVRNRIPITVDYDGAANEMSLVFSDGNFNLLQNTKGISLTDEKGQPFIANIEYSVDKIKSEFSIVLLDYKDFIFGDTLYISLVGEDSSTKIELNFRDRPTVEGKLLSADDSAISNLSEKKEIEIKGEKYIAVRYFKFKNNNSENVNVRVGVVNKNHIVQAKVFSSKVTAKSCSHKVAKSEKIVRKDTFYVLPLNKQFATSIGKIKGEYDEESVVPLAKDETLYAAAYIKKSLLDYYQGRKKPEPTINHVVPLSCDVNRCEKPFHEKGRKSWKTNYLVRKMKTVKTGSLSYLTEMHFSETFSFDYEQENKGTQKVLRPFKPLKYSGSFKADSTKNSFPKKEIYKKEPTGCHHEEPKPLPGCRPKSACL